MLPSSIPRREKSLQQLRQSSVITRFGKMFDPVLVAPAIVQHNMAIELAEIHIRIADVFPMGHARALGVTQ